MRAPRACEQRRNISHAVLFADDGQCQSLKAFQQVLGRRAVHRPFRVSGIQPRQPRPFGGQASADHTLKLSRHPQAYRQQTTQAGCAAIPFPRHRGQREVASFPQAHVRLHEILKVVGSHRLRSVRSLTDSNPRCPRLPCMRVTSIP